MSVWINEQTNELANNLYRANKKTNQINAKTNKQIKTNKQTPLSPFPRTHQEKSAIKEKKKRAKTENKPNSYWTQQSKWTHKQLSTRMPTGYHIIVRTAGAATISKNSNLNRLDRSNSISSIELTDRSDHMETRPNESMNYKQMKQATKPT